MVEKGEHEGTLMRAVWDTNNPGTPQAKTVVRVQVSVEGQTLTGTLWLDTERKDSMERTAKDKTFSLLRSCGWRGGKSLDGVSGKVMVTVDHTVSQKNGKTYANAKYVNEYRSFEPKAAPSDAMLSALLGDDSPTSDSDDKTDDDIPF